MTGFSGCSGFPERHIPSSFYVYSLGGVTQPSGQTNTVEVLKRRKQIEEIVKQKGKESNWLHVAHSRAVEHC